MAVFSVFALGFSTSALAQRENTNDDHHYQAGDEKTGHGDPSQKEEEHGKFDANEVIFGHVMDAHEYHFFSIGDFHATLPLPVIVYEPGRGWLAFMSSKFHHGEEAYQGYRLVTKHYKERLKQEGMTDEQINLLSDEQIVAVDEQTGALRPDIKVYDFSLTRNVVQMILALALLVWLMLSVAKRYRQGQGVKTAPKGWQNAVEPVITFVRDEVAKPNIGHKYRRYMPLLLTIFFFILINNIFGLIPGSANVTGNIAFTAVLGLIAFLAITFSGNKHYWGHIFNPPVPFGIKFIMIPVEILSIFTKPFALIIRLFANMLAGHIIIICLVSLIFIFGAMSPVIGSVFSPISIAFAVFIYVIEVLVAFIQAFIFTNLTAVFIGQAVEETHHGEDDHHQAPTEPVII
ncbi:MAG TPA: F0F1 ATP synthase subunit A [Flavisolibacter sp.]|nr:F0F1 ATP synthase subunit A [Flavisolibacter sp.]